MDHKSNLNIKFYINFIFYSFLTIYNSEGINSYVILVLLQFPSKYSIITLSNKFCLLYISLNL